MPTTARRKELDRKKRERRLRSLASVAHRIERNGLVDKQDVMLDGLDDGWESIRQKIIELAGERGEWAGYPLPIEHTKLSIEPRHPLYATMNGATLASESKADDDDSGVTVVNSWTDRNRGRKVYVWRDADGRAHGTAIPTYQSTRRASMVMETIGASQAWSVRAEFTAMARLKTLITAVAFRYYLLTGTFIETSPRSGIIYIFRKCRPTLAIGSASANDDTKVLAALCLHPIGYYERTYAGSMPPTDDVIAHLVMMRGDERKYWSKCNQHDCRAAEAGV